MKLARAATSLGSKNKADGRLWIPYRLRYDTEQASLARILLRRLRWTQRYHFR